ncbi:NAD(P)H-hydrate dehydratase [uncultured Piscinibacter sp.]|mgnify:CR=1 FL=1|uniref:NAD(P)H-hydrate dehydratase n=1 Tax=uncultured Piscinibacter sp. TaxID=1131835 RepID=UPI002637AC01|nr:NAD(P)H-hydrate dehydratase [uncultured Piscinibacter sp.]
MRRLDTHTPDLPLFDVAHTRRIEAAALTVLPPHALLQRAGAAVARLALALAPHARVVRILAGVGNNGGDGLDAAIRLQHAGKPVEVVLLGEPQPDDARDALARAHDAGVAVNPTALSALGPQDLAIDALLGIGASRAAEGMLREAIVGLNALPCPVLAIDLPSGLAANTGQPLGDAVRAQHTLSLLTVKPGLFTASGRDHAGTVWFDDLGVDTSQESPEAWLGGARSAALHRRRHAQHKGSFGDLMVVGGAPGMGGAALLAGRAALAAGAGRVFVDLLDPQAPALDAGRPELMLRFGWSRQADAEALARSTVVCGCGGGDSVRSVLPRLLGGSGRLVLDADALNAVAADGQLRKALCARAGRAQATVLTPHPLEAARLLGLGSTEVQADRLAAARELADEFASVVVLKGSGSVIAAPGRAPRINASGNVALATAGTGDVLAGWLGGHWAQRPEADAAERAWHAAVHAVWRHGATADACGARILRAADLIEQMTRFDDR